ncbi:MAG: uroporphyrinogen decarboxylase family protein [Bacteroidota bacterium]
MTRRERLIATINGKTVDRPAVNFYEIGGFLVNPDDPDEYNIYNAPSWQPLLCLAETRTDIIRLVSPVRAQSHLSWDGSEHTVIRKQFVEEKIWEENDSRFTRLTFRIGSKELTSLTRRDKNLDTVWTVESLLKNTDDVKLFLELPDEIFEEKFDIAHLEEQEKMLGDSGIVMVDTEDPVCAVAALFNLEDFTIFAFTEPVLCHKLLEKHAHYIHKRTEKVAKEFPGRLWRIYGPEYITEPFLPPSFFEDYVVKYTGPMVKQIKKHGGIVRIHAHGRIKNVLDYIVQMGADATDPIEPPPHGDVELKYIREKYGKQLVLFGNIEICDIESMPSDMFRRVVKQSIADGTSGEGRGFVLTPTSAPYGRTISERTLRNYQIMVEEVENI